jgi:DNA polymerase III delta subunit
LREYVIGEIGRVFGKNRTEFNFKRYYFDNEEDNSWEEILSEAIEREDAAVYLDILKYLFINGIKPSFIIGTLISYYHKIYTAKFLMKHHFSIADISKVLQQPQFILNKFITLVKNFPDFKIQEVLNLIYRLDYESKTSSEESARLSLQNFIFQIKFLK